MTDPNINATPQSVADSLSGDDESGNQLSYRKVAMLYPAHMFGLNKDYAFPEGSNEASSILDEITTLAKLETRTATLADGNTYDLYDMVRTVTKWILLQDKTINDDEPLSVNYKAPSA